MRKIHILITLLLTTIACSNPTPGPDKTLAGAVLGAGWGAGAGAVIGNQLDYPKTGEGAAIGAGFGLVSGAISGYGYDRVENAQLKQQQQLDALRVHNMANSRELANLQDNLDVSNAGTISGGVYQVFFDVDQTNLRAGSIANLEVIAESIKANAANIKVHVVGHSDNSGTPDYNSRLANTRASTVSSYLAARGVNIGRIKVESFGAERPIATNNTEAGRQLNRRVDIYISPA